jgi:hypothetical protein
MMCLGQGRQKHLPSDSERTGSRSHLVEPRRARVKLAGQLVEARP